MARGGPGTASFLYARPRNLSLSYADVIDE